MNLRRDLDRKTRRIESLDTAHAALARDQPVPIRFAPDSKGRDTTHSGNDNSPWMRQRFEHANASISGRLVKICGFFLNFLTALVAEFCAGTQFRMTVGTGGWSKFSAALDAELRTGSVLMTTLRTRYAGRWRWL